MTTQEMITKVSVGLEALAATVTEIRADVKEQGSQYVDITQRLTLIETRQKDMQDDIKGLTKVVRDGNGQPSLLTRITHLEVTHAQLTHRAYEMQGHLNTVQTARVLSRGQLWAGIFGMVITALMSMGAIIAQLIK